MKLNFRKVNDYISPSKLSGADYVINPYIGCPHACKYCYAVFMKRFTDHNEDWGTFIDIKQCDKGINLKKIYKKKVFLSSVTDCYNPFEEKYRITRMILEEISKVDCTIHIATKSDLILRDIDILQRIKNLRVSISINTLDEKFKDDMDKAVSIERRLYALKKLHIENIKTVLFMSPIFPLITDFRGIIEKSNAYVTEYWFENLNLRDNYKNIILSYIYHNYPQYYNIYENIYINGNNAYWENYISNIEEYCTKHSIVYKNYFTPVSSSVGDGL